MPTDAASGLSAIEMLPLAHPGLSLLVLHGSRARRDANENSDWDFAFLATRGFDPALLYADLAVAVGTDRIDLVDLASAGGLIRYRVARDGIVLFEAVRGTWDKFWFEAVSFWCDAAPVLRAGYEAVLDELGP